ncbi:hypothetical protein M0R45_019509 [Rubus argutus]|uniref:Uncharacterized protein n=1 Tax=Rubus argutus TaxID=59490 RepID=A0AAW1X8C1_RUBAR
MAWQGHGIESLATQRRGAAREQQLRAGQRQTNSDAGGRSGHGSLRVEHGVTYFVAWGQRRDVAGLGSFTGWATWNCSGVVALGTTWILGSSTGS